MIGDVISNSFESRQIKKCYLIMHNIPKTQDTAQTSVNHRRKLQVLKICNCFNFFKDIVLMCCRTYFETKYSYFNNPVKPT